MDKTSLIGIVTVTYNSSNVLLPFLECAARQTHQDFILFAVDNASKDNTLQIMQDFADPRVRVIANTINVGIAEGNNQGIRAALDAGCDSILLLNNDTEFGPTLFEQLTQSLGVEMAEMVCPKIMYYDEPNRIWAAGGRFQSLLGYRSVHYGEGELDHGQYDLRRLVTYVPTCCVLIAKEVFAAVGLMDARYFIYVDDVDFMYRAMKAGVKLLYLPEATLLHKVSSLTGQESSSSMIRYCTRNRVFFLLKHLGFVRACPFIVAYQFHFLLGLITGRLKLQICWEKERAVLQALRMWRSSSPGDIIR